MKQQELKDEIEIKQGWCYKKRNYPYLIIEFNTKRGNKMFIISYSETINLYNSIERVLKKRKLINKNDNKDLWKKINDKIKVVRGLEQKYRKRKDFKFADYFLGKKEALKWVLKVKEKK